MPLSEVKAESKSVMHHPVKAKNGKIFDEDIEDDGQIEQDEVNDDDDHMLMEDEYDDSPQIELNNGSVEEVANIPKKKSSHEKKSKHSAEDEIIVADNNKMDERHNWSQQQPRNVGSQKMKKPIIKQASGRTGRTSKGKHTKDKKSKDS